MPRWPPYAAESISPHERRGPCCSRSPGEFPARCWTSRRWGSTTWTGTNEGSSVHVELEQRQRVSFLDDVRDFGAVRRRNVVGSALEPVAIRGVSFGSPHLLDVTHHGNSRHVHLSAATVVRLCRSGLLGRRLTGGGLRRGRRDEAGDSSLDRLEVRHRLSPWHQPRMGDWARPAVDGAIEIIMMIISIASDPLLSSRARSSSLSSVSSSSSF